MDLSTIPCLVIHREQDTERAPSIFYLEQALGRSIQRFEAISGDSLLEQGFPSKHPREPNPTSAGNIGCTASHIEILEAALRGGYTHCCIFEDDAEVVGAVKPYLAEVNQLPPADLIFLGVNEIVEGEATANPGIQIVQRFWGTHAVIVGRRAMLAIFEVYTQSLKDGYALPADWLYSFAIKEKGLIAYAPSIPTVRQRPGLTSLTSGNVRLAVT
jgi:GR25 family glycosyltransferase involved in LPS biosynthesis